MSSIFDVLFDILELPLKRWDKLKFVYKAGILIILLLILFAVGNYN